MTCKERDENLLLLLHGELRGWKRFRTQAHLLACASCRTRHAEFARISQAVADAGGTSAKRLTGSSRAFTRKRPKIAFWIVLLLLVALTARLAFIIVSSHAFHARQRPSVPPPLCAPGLASDQCR